MKKAKTLSDKIYCLEPLAYYYNITPDIFWKSRFKEIYLYCEMQSIRTMEKFKEEIILQEAVSNKLIQADALSNKKPKIVSLKDIFKNLFK